MEIRIKPVGKYVELLFEFDNTKITTELLDKEEVEEYLRPMREAIIDCEIYFE